jgi:hypothetical protein
MVRARLHLICGNCGCNDEWEWEYQPPLIHEGDVDDDEGGIYLWCKNCGTLHSISNNAKKKGT